MKKQKNNIVRVTLDEARNVKSQSRPAQIIAQHEKDGLREEAKSQDH